MKLFQPDRLNLARNTRRRIYLGTVVLVLTGLAVAMMADLFWRSGFDLHKGFILGLFTLLFANISFGFAQALFGFYLRLKGGDFCRITRSVDWADGETQLAPTAVVMPICNEEVSRVFEGLRVIFESVERTGNLESFDFFILSDSPDPNRWIEEEAAWVALTRQLGARGRLFYRKRKIGTNKKSGNLADFCRRWGKLYRYMVVLDADSIMSGESVVRLIRMMEKNPGVGIIQTAPQLVRGTSLFARMQQFSSRLYGPIFQAGLNYWQQGEGNYWGHNAAIRLAPFIEHCALPDLPGSQPFGGKILSHDYVEAALMRRGGWSVWLAYDLEESYEEGPVSLIDFAKRDRRWCQGNLQHSWLLAARGLKAVSRLHLALGILAYVASPLWLAFLLLSTLLVYRFEATGLSLIATGSFMGSVRIGVEQQALLLLLGTLLVLFLPKVLSLLDLARHQGARGFGGWRRLLIGVVLENLTSVLVAPILMLFHSRFVAAVLLGRGVGWAAQRREGTTGLDLRESIPALAGHTLVGLAWGISGFLIHPALFVWMLPVLLGLVGSIPVSLVTASERLGRAVRFAGLFLTPDELEPTEVLARLERHLDACRNRPRPLAELMPDYGLVQAVLDPYVNAVHVSLLREKDQGRKPEQTHLDVLRERLLRDGPGSLTPREKTSLLMDPDSVIWLHSHIWSRPAAALASWWQLAIRQYNMLTPVPPTGLYR
jgi:membrane glycosyltransferase